MKADQLPENVRDAIQRVIDYNWHSEQEDANEQLKENGNIDGHTFADLVILRNFLRDQNESPESFLDEVEEETDSDD